MIWEKLNSYYGGFKQNSFLTLLCAWMKRNLPAEITFEPNAPVYPSAGWRSNLKYDEQHNIPDWITSVVPSPFQSPSFLLSFLRPPFVSVFDSWLLWVLIWLWLCMQVDSRFSRCLIMCVPAGIFISVICWNSHIEFSTIHSRSRQDYAFLFYKWCSDTGYVLIDWVLFRKA